MGLGVPDAEPQAVATASGGVRASARQWDRARITRIGGLAGLSGPSGVPCALLRTAVSRRFSLHGFGFRGHSHPPGSPDRTEQICHSEPMSSTIARQPPERLWTQERRYGRPCCCPFPDSPPGPSAPAWFLRFWGVKRGRLARHAGVPGTAGIPAGIPGTCPDTMPLLQYPLLPFSPANR